MLGPQMSGNGPNLALQAKQVNLVALDGCPGDKMNLHVHSSEWMVEQVEVLLAHHTDRYKSEQY
jgi:hypothetical protein